LACLGLKWQVPPASTEVQIDGSAGCSLEPRKSTPSGASNLCIFASSVLREIQHHIAQEDHVKSIVCPAKRQLRTAKIGLPEVAHPLDLRLHHPILAAILKIANDKPRRKPAIHLDAVIRSRLRPCHHLS